MGHQLDVWVTIDPDPGFLIEWSETCDAVHLTKSEAEQLLTMLAEKLGAKVSFASAR